MTAQNGSTAGEVLDLLNGVAFGRYPEQDGIVRVLPDAPGPASAVLGFTAHFVVCAPVDPAWVHELLPAGDLSAPLGARFVASLADRLGADIGANDAVFVAVADGAHPAIELLVTDDREHPRVARARRYRHDLRVWVTPRRDALLLVGRGVAGRWEVSFDVALSARGQGLGRALAGAALGLLPAGTPVFAQVTPGNAASMRAVLSAGYRPIGAEVLLPRREHRPVDLARG